MFPFQSGELSFHISTDVGFNTVTTNHPFQPPPQGADPLNNIDGTNSNLIKTPKSKKGRSSKATTTTTVNNDDVNNEISGNGVAKRKISHREVERQRRQEMSNLHSSLRTLLPLEYVRGKRSICDHVTEATKYIQELEKNVKELGDQRDKLKGSIPSLLSEQQQQQQQQQQIIMNENRDFGCSSSSSASTSSTRSDYSVSIHKFSRTLQIEIVVGSGVGDEGSPYPLSKALRVLADERLDVVSCVSSIVNQRWIYVIYCEVNEVTSIETSQLQQKLLQVIHR
nr:hypothetical protein [Suaeda aralocaspica]